MLKTILTFVLIVISTCILTAQETPAELAPPVAVPMEISDEVISSPIFPGCESIADANSPEMENCFRNIIRNKITDRLMMKTHEIGVIGMDRLNSIVTLVVSKEGLVTDVKIESANSAEYGKIVEEEMKQLAAKLPAIIPAKNKDGEPVNYMYRIPVTFVFVD